MLKTGNPPYKLFQPTTRQHFKRNIAISFWKLIHENNSRRSIGQQAFYDCTDEIKSRQIGIQSWNIANYLFVIINSSGRLKMKCFLSQVWWKGYGFQPKLIFLHSKRVDFFKRSHKRASTPKCWGLACFSSIHGSIYFSEVFGESVYILYA